MVCGTKARVGGSAEWARENASPRQAENALAGETGGALWR